MISHLLYRFVVASSDILNLTVIVEDEYTYFVDDRPLLSGATVRLTGRYGQETLEQITDDTGNILIDIALP